MNSIPVYALATALAFAGLSSPATSSVIAAGNRKAAPNFALKDSKGALVELSKYRGKVVLLDFWSTWCGGCKVEVPWFVEFQSRYGSRGFVVIGISMDEEGWSVVKPFMAEKKINYPVCIGDEAVTRRYAVNEMPLTLLIDRDGKIAATHVGLIGKDVFEREIRTLLDDNAGKAR